MGMSKRISQSDCVVSQDIYQPVPLVYDPSETKLYDSDQI